MTVYEPSAIRNVAVVGHIHEGRGEWRLGRTVLANVSIVNSAYKVVHPLWMHELAGV